MMITVEATFENGTFKPVQPVSLPEGTAVQLQVSPVDPNFDPLEAVIGIGEGPPEGDGSAKHDKYIYGSRGAANETTEQADESDPLEEVIGICDDGPDISLAERHDEFIYGVKLDQERKA